MSPESIVKILVQKGLFYPSVWFVPC